MDDTEQGQESESPEDHISDGPDAEPSTQTAASEPSTDPTERKPRKAKRDDFVNDVKQKAEEATRQIQQEREHRIRLEAQISEMRQHITPRQKADGADDYNKRMSEARQRYEMAAASGAGAKTAAEARMHLDVAWKAQEEMNDIQAERREASLIEKFRGMIPDRAQQREAEVIASEFPWVRTDEEARALADAKYNKLIRGGRPHGLETLREAAAQTAQQLRLGGRSAPTQQQRRAYEGTETRDGEGGGPGTGRGLTPEFVKNHDGYRKLALARYSDLEPDAAIKKWVERVGSKLGTA